MQALACEVARARTKLGIEIAASKAMIATTIMISTSVNPAGRLVWIVFILYSWREPSTSGLAKYIRFTDCLLKPRYLVSSTTNATIQIIKIGQRPKQKPRGRSLGVMKTKGSTKLLLELVSRGERTQRAGRVRADSRQGISAVGRAAGDARAGVQLDVGRQIRGQGERRTGRLALFQSPLVGRRVNLAKVVDAGIRLRCRTRFHKVRNRNRCQQADDGHNDHDFYQREARLTDVFGLFHFVYLSFFKRLNIAADGLYDNDFVHLIVCCNRYTRIIAPPMPKSSFTEKVSD